jgi:hypothetical protein
MFRSRRRLRAAAGFWVLFLAAIAVTSTMPGVSAATASVLNHGFERGTLSQWTRSSGMAVETRRKRPRRRYVKTLDSRNADDGGGLSEESDNCTLTRSELRDTFALQSSSTRCTWTNAHFSHMGRHEVFDVEMRFDSRPTQSTDWENEILLRPDGSRFGNENCSSGGNAQVMLLRLWVDRRPSPDVWRLDLRGGKSLNLSDQVVTRLRLGPVLAGRTLKLGFDIVADYLHGAASVWKNGVRVYRNRDRPLGFHYDCDGTTDISNFALRMQHGVYRGGGGLATLSSSGFRFRLSRRVR